MFVRIAILLTCFATIGYAAGGWEKLPAVTANNLNCLSFIDSLHGWVAGDGGTILRTTTGGNSWTLQQSGIVEDISAINFVDSNFGWALAIRVYQDTTSYGTLVLRTTNGGITWTHEGSDTTRTLNNVAFGDPFTGIAVGNVGTILRTTDGGDSWNVHSSGTTRALNGVFLRDANKGTVVGDSGTILRTVDGGIHWLVSAQPLSRTLRGVAFVPSGLGIIAGDAGTILRTTDGGENWNAVNSGTLRSLHDVALPGGLLAVAVGEAGTVIRSTNGGATWDSVSGGGSATLYHVTFRDANHGHAVGDAGTILRTTDGGASWVTQLSGDSVSFRSVVMTGVDTAIITGDLGRILTTTDGGTTWITQWSATLNSLRGLTFTDPVNGTLVGTNGKILHTSSNGIYWTDREYPISYFYTVTFLDSLVGWVGGLQGKIRKSTDGGITWTPAYVEPSLHSSFPILRMRFFTPMLGFATGGRMDQAGIVWRTTDGGDHWESSNPSGAPIHGIHRVDSLNFVGVDGEFDLGAGFIHTKDAGRSWEYRYIGIWGEALSMSFRTTYEAHVAMGFPCTYMVTRDTGATWEQFYTPDSTAMYELAFTDSLHGYMVGKRGTVLRYNPVLVHAEERENSLPVALALQQNYPNPFNPVTRISFDLPVNAAVTLKVYDILGREVRTLFDGMKTAGSHLVFFDGRELASGVYFYQLTTTTQSARTVLLRKMALVK
jgi:photosystem II stability/assembly factor-like uncharacterized protein